jgi:hypothetical protein
VTKSEASHPLEPLPIRRTTTQALVVYNGAPRDDKGIVTLTFVTRHSRRHSAQPANQTHTQKKMIKPDTSIIVNDTSVYTSWMARVTDVFASCISL